MRINCINNNSFKQNISKNKDKENKENKIKDSACFVLGMLAYDAGEIMHLQDNNKKATSNTAQNFKNLSLKDKTKCISKFALSYLVCPLAIMVGVASAAIVIDKFRNSKSADKIKSNN